MKVDDFILFQQEGGGLAVVRTRFEHTRNDFQYRISASYTDNFRNWLHGTLLMDPHQYYELPSILATQIAANKMAKIEDSKKYKLTEIASIGDYRCWVGAKDGHFYFSAFPLSEFEYGEVTRIRMNDLPKEKKFLSANIGTEDFLRFAAQETLVGEQEPD